MTHTRTFDRFLLVADHGWELAPPVPQYVPVNDDDDDERDEDLPF